MPLKMDGKEDVRTKTKSISVPHTNILRIPPTYSISCASVPLSISSPMSCHHFFICGKLGNCFLCCLESTVLARCGHCIEEQTIKLSIVYSVNTEEPLLISLGLVNKQFSFKILFAQSKSSRRLVR